MLLRVLILLSFLLLSGCVSYYEEYEESYYVPASGYSYYNSPLRLRGLSENDFYMLDNYPGDYLNAQFWSGVGSVSRFAIHGILQNMAY